MTSCGILTQFGQYDRCVNMPQEEAALHYQMIAQYLLDRWDDAPSQISSPWWDDDLVLFGKSKPFHCAASNRIPLFFVGCIHLKCWGSLVGSNRNEVIASFLAEPAIDWVKARFTVILLKTVSYISAALKSPYDSFHRGFFVFMTFYFGQRYSKSININAFLSVIKIFIFHKKKSTIFAYRKHNQTIIFSCHLNYDILS